MEDDQHETYPRLCNLQPTTKIGLVAETSRYNGISLSDLLQTAKRLSKA